MSWGQQERITSPITISSSSNSNSSHPSHSNDDITTTSIQPVKDRRPSNATTTATTISPNRTFSTYLATSPRSPLSSGSFFPHSQSSNHTLPPPLTPFDYSPNQRRRSSQLFSPPPPPPLSPSSSASASAAASSNRNRRSSLSKSLNERGNCFVGSYENSLLSGRMSSATSKTLPFLVSIGSLSSSSMEKGKGKVVECSPHLNLNFGASFYPSSSSGTGTITSTPSSTVSPYVGTIDLESHYFSLLSPLPFSPPLPLNSIPKFPGYKLPQKGQLQLIVKNVHSTAMKVFLIPFDLSGLDRNGEGGKTFLRQKSYASATTTTIGGGGGGEEGKERLRFAVHVQFCSPPTTTSKSSSKESTKKIKSEPSYYLYGTIRVVFASRALDSSEQLRTVLEGPEGILSSSSSNHSSYTTPYIGPGIEWELSRKKLKEGIKRDLLTGSIRDSVTITSSTTSTVVGFNPLILVDTIDQEGISNRRKRKPFDPNHAEDEEDEEEEEEEGGIILSTPTNSTPSYLSLRRPLLSTPPSPLVDLTFDLARTTLN